MANMISGGLRGLLDERQVDTPVARVVRALSGHGAVSTAQIARTTGLARSTVSTILADLRRSSLVVEVETRSPGIGRPALAHSLNPEAGTCLGVLLGRNELRVVLADVAHNIVADVAIPLEQDYKPERATRTAKQAIDNIYKEHSLPYSGLLASVLPFPRRLPPVGASCGARSFRAGRVSICVRPSSPCCRSRSLPTMRAIARPWPR